MRDGLDWSGQPREATSVYRARSPQAHTELRRLLAERDARLDVYDQLDEQLKAQRRREWAEYGHALKTRVEAAAADTDGLTVPVHVTVDLDSQGLDLAGTSGSEWGLVDQLLDTATSDTPTPADLPGTPLERPEQTITSAGDRPADGD